MTIAQNIFTIFFAIYFAVIIGRTNSLGLFGTSEMMNIKKYPKSWLRFGFSIIFANIIPLGYFWYVLNRLGLITTDEAYKNFLILLNIFLQSIVGFGFYRILFGILLLKKDGSYIFYDEDQKKVLIERELKNRSEIQKYPRTHIVPGVFWVLITFACAQLLGIS